MENTNQNWARRFYTLWTGQALSLLGSQMVQFAIIWYLTQETNSSTTLAIASMMGLLPNVLLSMSAAMLVSPIALIIAGPFADKFGIQPWFIIAGISCIVMGILGFFIPDVMNIENRAKEESINPLPS